MAQDGSEGAGMIDYGEGEPKSVGDAVNMADSALGKPVQPEPIREPVPEQKQEEPATVHELRPATPFLQQFAQWLHDLADRLEGKT